MKHRENIRLDRAFSLGQSIASMAAEAERRQRTVQVLRATAVMMVVLAAGTWGFDALTGGEHSLLTCLYMTVVTVSTVGFTEVIPTDTDALKALTIGLILFGGGAILYFITSVTAVVVEGDLLYRFWRQRTRARLERLKDHVIIAGLGRTGLRTLEELIPSRTPVVVVDHDPERLELAVRLFGESLLFIGGDALEEEILEAARIDRALGLVAALSDDRENLFLTVTARQLNPRLRLAAKIMEPANAHKFEQFGGVNASVDQALVGGWRLANELFRPELMAFTDVILSSESVSKSLAVVSIEIPQVLGALQDQSNCLILGVRDGNRGPYRYGPSVNTALSPGVDIMALGYWRDLRRLRQLVGAAVEPSWRLW